VVIAAIGGGDELQFVGGVYGCKSGGEPPHSKVGEEARCSDRADMGRGGAAALQRQTPRAQSGVTVPQEKPERERVQEGMGHGASKRAGWSACLGCAECGAIPCPDDYSDRMGAAF